VTSNSKISAREHNLQSILHLLHIHKSLSAKQLSTLTGLSVVSINKLIELLELKNILTVDFTNTRGRRAKTYQINYQAYTLGALQLHEVHDYIKANYSLIDLSGKIISQTHYEENITSVEQLLEFIKLHTDESKPQKIIVGIPGDELNGYLQLIDVKALRGIKLSKAIEVSTDIDTIIVNDINACIFGAASSLHESQNIAAGIYFPKLYGPGVGIVINDQLITGADGLAGEVQYGTVDQKESPKNQIIDHLRNIISLINPNLLIAYIDELNLTDLEINQIIQTLHRYLPLHQNYKLDFNRNFQDDYLLGLATIGRNIIFKKLSGN
jgi:Transcriptional regulator/sugar kinase